MIHSRTIRIYGYSWTALALSSVMLFGIPCKTPLQDHTNLWLQLGWCSHYDGWCDWKSFANIRTTYQLHKHWLGRFNSIENNYNESGSGQRKLRKKYAGAMCWINSETYIYLYDMVMCLHNLYASKSMNKCSQSKRIWPPKTAKKIHPKVVEWKAGTKCSVTSSLGWMIPCGPSNRKSAATEWDLATEGLQKPSQLRYAA